MDLKLAGKAVVITGSSRGIGLATAKALAAESINRQQLAEAGAALRASGAEVVALVADVSEPGQAAAEAERASPIAPMTIGGTPWSAT